MIVALTILVAVMTFAQLTIDVITIRWHHQDRKNRA